MHRPMLCAPQWHCYVQHSQSSYHMLSANTDQAMNPSNDIKAVRVWVHIARPKWYHIRYLKFIKYVNSRNARTKWPHFRYNILHIKLSPDLSSFMMLQHPWWRWLMKDISWWLVLADGILIWKFIYLEENHNWKRYKS